MNLKQTSKLVIILASLVIMLIITPESVHAKKNFTITPNSVFHGVYEKSVDLNRFTRHTFLFRYYLDELEAAGGGTLTVKKGTYKISNVMYIPSNVTIKFEDGVKLIKINKTGNARFEAAQGMFQVVPYKQTLKKSKIRKYKGARNVNIIGKGNVIIDMKNVKYAKAITAAHCQNVTIKGITFKNMNSGHFLEIDAAKNLTISDCTFDGAAKATSYTKEAINIDIPDKETGGVNLPWSSMDKTACTNITVKNCTFANLKRGVGSHKYSQKGNTNCYHTQINISDCTFDKISDTGIFMLNWSGISVLDNTFTDNNLCLNFRGVVGQVDLSGNDFTDSVPVQTFSQDRLYYMGYKSPGKGSKYSEIYNDLPFETLEELLEYNDL